MTTTDLLNMLERKLKSTIERCETAKDYNRDHEQFGIAQLQRGRIQGLERALAAMSGFRRVCTTEPAEETDGGLTREEYKALVKVQRDALEKALGETAQLLRQKSETDEALHTGDLRLNVAFRDIATLKREASAHAEKVRLYDYVCNQNTNLERRLQDLRDDVENCKTKYRGTICKRLTEWAIGSKQATDIAIRASNITAAQTTMHREKAFVYALDHVDELLS